MNKLTTYYKSIIEEGNNKLSIPGYYLNALAFIEREVAMVEQGRQTSKEAILMIDDYLFTCYDV